MDSTQCEVRGGVWVCKECGFAYSMAWRNVIRRLSTASDRWRQAVGRLEPASTDLGVRPGLWSPREYVAHMADWAEIIAGRIVLILREGAPFIEDIDQDQRAAELGYDHGTRRHRATAMPTPWHESLAPLNLEEAPAGREWAYARSWGHSR